MTTSTDDIATIFARDPLTLTNDDISRIVERLRAARANFVAGGSKATKAAAPKIKEMDLDSLGL